MTYNFDPEGWLDRQRLALDARHAKGDIDDADYAEALEDLDRRFDEMVDRLDGTYEIQSEKT